MKWTDHIDHVYSKLVKHTGIFYKLRNKIPSNILKNIYFAFVHPHLLYGIEVYGNTCPTYLDKLGKLNNKLLRILQNRPIRSPVISLYENYNTLPVKELHEYQILQFVQKAVHHPNLLPPIFTNYFQANESIHDHNTRTKSDIHIKITNNSYGSRSLKIRGSTMWNNLPIDLKCQMSTGNFKEDLQTHLICNYN